MEFKIGTTTIHKSVHTLGLEVIQKTLKKAGYDPVSVDYRSAKECDVLLVSLYWVDQVLEYPKWLIKSKIDPSKKGPL
jgi:hypothetical protein